jgi:hypothetical protein
MRNTAIADTSAAHNHSKEKIKLQNKKNHFYENKYGRLVALLGRLLTQVHIAFQKNKLFTYSLIKNNNNKSLSILQRQII